MTMHLRNIFADGELERAPVCKESLHTAAAPGLKSGEHVRTRWLQYVRHADVPFYLAARWSLESTFEDAHHSAYSVLLIWEGEGDPPKPKHDVLEAAE